MSSHSADVVVIGGGLAGAWMAYWLSLGRRSVVVVDAYGVASGTSGSGGGSLSLMDKKPGLPLTLSRDAAQFYEQLQDEVGTSIGLNISGGLAPILAPQSLDEVAEYVAPLTAAGLPIHLLDRKAAREIEPALSEEIVGAAHCPLEGIVDPLRAVHALFAMAASRSARIATEERGAQLKYSRGGFVGEVLTRSGSIACGAVVLAAGVWINDVLQSLNTRLPVYARKGHIVGFEPGRPIVRTAIHEGSYFGGKFASQSANDLIVALAAEQRGGILRIGSSREFKGIDRTIDPPVVSAIIRRAADFLPVVRSLRSVYVGACLRPYVPDHYPLVGRLPGWENVYVLTGHEGDGLALIPGTARRLVDTMDGKGEYLAEIDAGRRIAFMDLESPA